MIYSNKSWDEVKKEINLIHGFESATPDIENLNLKFGYKISSSEKNFLNLSFSIRKEKHLSKINSFKFETGIYNKKECLYFNINDNKFIAGAVFFYFDCKNCFKVVKIEGNPKRGISEFFDCFLCKICKNKIIHKCKDYQEKFSLKMKEKYGIAESTPFRIPEVRKQMKDEMIKRHGVPYCGLSPILLKKTWSKWNKKAVASKFEIDVSNFIKSISKLKIYDAIDPYVFDFNKKTFVPDIVIPEIQVIFECFGDYWHGNPEIYKEEDIIAGGKFTRKECNEKDQNRIEKLEKNLNYKVFIIWENSWNKKKNETQNKIREIINEKTAFLSKK